MPYPFSSPVSKFLDWENGVVGESKEDWELREGIAKEGKGKEIKDALRAKESKLGKSIGFTFGSEFCSLGLGFWRQSEALVSERVEFEANGDRRRWWPIKIKIFMSV